MSDETVGARPESAFRLGEWTVRPAQNRLMSPKGTRHLEPRAMDLLCALVARSGRVVAKDTLINQVWEGRIISEGTLSNTVAELRQALGDDARSPRYIETIPKRGYRLLVDVEAIRAVGPRPGVPRPWRWILLATVATAALAGAILLGTRARAPQPVAVDRLPSVQVEPFADRTERPELASLAPMATDWVVKGLVDTGLVRVVRGGEDGRSTLVISGACYAEGELCACRAEVALGDGTLLAALEPTAAAEPSAMAEEVRQRVTGAVATHLGAHAHSRLLLSRPPRLEAWQEFAAGSLLFGGDTVAAVRHLERAVELDPEFFSARFRLAFAQRQVGLGAQAAATLAALDAERERRTPFERLWLDVANALFSRRLEEAHVCLRRLQELLPDDLAVNHLAGSAALALNRPEAALQDYERIDLSALGAEYRQALVTAVAVRNHAEALSRLGRHREALALVESARSVLPDSPPLDAAEIASLAALGDLAGIERLLEGPLVETPDGPGRGDLLILGARTLRAHGHLEASKGLADRAAGWWRERAGEPSAALALAESLAYAERWAEAEGVLRTAIAARPDQPRQLAWLAVVAGRQGDRDTVREVAGQTSAVDGSSAAGWPTFWRAVVAGETGDGTRSAELLQQACREGWGSWWMLIDSMLLEPVRDDPRVREVLRPQG